MTVTFLDILKYGIVAQCAKLSLPKVVTVSLSVTLSSPVKLLKANSPTEVMPSPTVIVVASAL